MHKLFIFIALCFLPIQSFSAGPAVNGETVDWGFNGPFGKFNKSSLQRGLQVYSEVCSSCHSLKYIAYRNLSDLGYNKSEIKAFASTFTVTDGPNDDGEMYTRPGKLSDKFVMPYDNVKAAQAANGGAYPPDMSVLVKARGDGVDYIYSLLQGYEDPPVGVSLDDGVYYNKYMYGNKIKMANQLSDGLVEYGDGTNASVEQMSKDVTTFLMWAAEPHLESRHQMGFKAIFYLVILTILVYFSMKKIWSRIETEV